ncbi:uncharacterized protein LOC133783941 [Humulus lupulus]|uniref:uncharacterized protein LOC133783941 n=1 Tax=Humulus lupulus TaxID=3486 RepID=UPI002B418490|nr:uncharacterized protein LOC133783941 [Humulus lupulus]
MELIKPQKLQSILKCYKNSQLLYNLIHSSMVALLICSLLCSYPYSFPSLTNFSFNYFVLISLPNIWSSFLNPKCLFILFNVIIVFLVSESTLKKSYPAIDIYSEYVERSKSSHRRRRRRIISHLHEEKKKEKKLETEMEMDLHEEKNEKMMLETKMDKSREGNNIVYEEKVVFELVEPTEEKHDEKSEEEEIKEVEEAPNNEDKKGKNSEKECEELPTEELNRRVEEFLARIKKRRLLEAIEC